MSERTAEEKDLQERLLDAWICINGTLKDSKITHELTYNEAIVMRVAYAQYEQDGVGSVPVQTIIKRTNMLKSLANRTIDSLCKKGMLVNEHRRSVSVRIVSDNLQLFESVHDNSLNLAQNLISIIGTEDAEAFIRCGEKLREANVTL